MIDRDELGERLCGSDVGFSLSSLARKIGRGASSAQSALVASIKANPKKYAGAAALLTAGAAAPLILAAMRRDEKRDEQQYEPTAPEPAAPEAAADVSLGLDPLGMVAMSAMRPVTRGVEKGVGHGIQGIAHGARFLVRRAKGGDPVAQKRIMDAQVVRNAARRGDLGAQAQLAAVAQDARSGNPLAIMRSTDLLAAKGIEKSGSVSAAASASVVGFEELIGRGGGGGGRGGGGRGGGGRGGGGWGGRGGRGWGRGRGGWGGPGWGWGGDYADPFAVPVFVDTSFDSSADEEEEDPKAEQLDLARDEYRRAKLRGDKKAMALLSKKIVSLST